ncbi:hypothetical protein PTI98_002875 [Pleurotus ostreatus]|nr:hypothetical protein PTI98_002875 [Pleurotus ostreatus]
MVNRVVLCSRPSTFSWATSRPPSPPSGTTHSLAFSQLRPQRGPTTVHNRPGCFPFPVEPTILRAASSVNTLLRRVELNP